MQGFVTTMLPSAAAMSVLALVYMAVTPLLARRYSVKSRYYAWLIIVIGFIVPFRPRFGNAIVKLDMPMVTKPLFQAGNVTSITTPVTPSVETFASPQALPVISWGQVMVAVWLVGMIAFLACQIIKHYRFMKMAKRWRVAVTDVETLRVFCDLKAEMGIWGRIDLALCASVGSPMLVGLVKPCILLPGLTFEKDELRFILKHELVHYRRKDLWYKWLVLLATAMHWFNPIMYRLAGAVEMLSELSCDEEVVRSADMDTRRQYSETIIGVVRRQSKLKTALSTNFYGGRKGVKKRIFSIMDATTKKAGSALILGALIVTLGTGFALAADANVGTPRAERSVAAALAQRTLDKALLYARYERYGLMYDEARDKLYYDGQLVRYFEDCYPLDENVYTGTDYKAALQSSESNTTESVRYYEGSGYIPKKSTSETDSTSTSRVSIERYNLLDENFDAGIIYFYEAGTIDVRGVRVLSQSVRNQDGSINQNGKFLGVQPYSQADFAARDVGHETNGTKYVVEFVASQSDLIGQGVTVPQLLSEQNEYGVLYDENRIDLNPENADSVLRADASFGSQNANGNAYVRVRAVYGEDGGLAYLAVFEKN